MHEVHNRNIDQGRHPLSSFLRPTCSAALRSRLMACMHSRVLPNFGGWDQGYCINSSP